MEGSVAPNKRKPRRPKYDGAQQFPSTASGGRTRPAVVGPDSGRRRSYAKNDPAGFRARTSSNSSSHRAKSGSSRSKRTAATAVDEEPIPKSKKTFRKPKHLKRKLDAAHDQTEKTEILVQLETLEMKKKRQKQSMTPTSSNNDSNGPLQPRSARTDKEQPSPGTTSTRGAVDRHDDTGGSSPSRGKEMGTQHHNDNDFVETAALVQDAPRRRRRRGRKDTTKVGEIVLGQPNDEESKCAHQSSTDTINIRKETRETNDSGRISEKISDTPQTTARTKGISAVGCNEKRKDDSDEIREEAPLKESATEPISVVADNNESSRDHEEGSSDSESSVDDTPLRQRGKKRRGRKDTSQIIQEQIPELNDDQDRNEVKTRDQSDGQKDRDRRCIGRKPLTDFDVGQSYPGTVVYIKPFGVFLDIGCHSDAFCHVSRLSDDYVESPEARFRPGDHVEAARVVEVDRRKKRITVSLQTEARMEDELASKDARQGRRDKLKRKKKNSNELTAFQKFSASAANDVKHRALVKPAPRSQITATTASALEKTFAKSESRLETAFAKPESEMSPAELKRGRKLARRAERREDKEQEQVQ